jgi:hypothetical protein
MVTYADRQAQQIRFEALQLEQLLSPAGIKPVFLKGAAYTLRNSANSMGRTCSDIDALILKTELRTAERVMQAGGWRSEPLSEYDNRYYREWAHEIPPIWHPIRGTVVDLHHNLLPPISGRAPLASVLFTCVETLPNGHRVLTAPATVLHSIIHLFVNDDISFGYRDLTDIWLLIDEFSSPEFWTELEDLARRTGFGQELWYALKSVKSKFPHAGISNDTLVSLGNNFDRPSKRWLLNHVLNPALRPNHSEVGSVTDRLASAFAYARGHWLKMPLGVLIKHTATKSWLAARDGIFGRYQFEKT